MSVSVSKARRAQSNGTCLLGRLDACGMVIGVSPRRSTYRRVVSLMCCVSRSAKFEAGGKKPYLSADAQTRAEPKESLDRLLSLHPPEVGEIGQVAVPPRASREASQRHADRVRVCFGPARTT